MTPVGVSLKALKFLFNNLNSSSFLENPLIKWYVCFKKMQLNFDALSKVKAVDLWDDIKELISFNHIDTQRCDL